MSDRQYQPLVAPFVPDAAAPETVTLDKWHGQAAPLVRRPVVAALLLSAVVAPIYVPDVTDPAPARAWAPSYPDRHVYRRAVEFPSAPIAPLHVPDVTDPVPALAWRATFPDRLHARVSIPAAAQQAFAFDRFTAPAEVIAPDLAAPGYPDRVPGRPPLRPHPWQAAPLFVPDVTQPVTALSWTARYPDRVPAAARLQPGAQPAFVSDPTTPSPPVTIDSWLARYPDRHFRPRLVPTGYQTFQVDVSLVSVPAQWYPSYPDYLWRRVPARVGWTVIDPSALTLAGIAIVADVVVQALGDVSVIVAAADPEVDAR